MSKQFNGYDLSRKWFDFSFENPDLITPTHAAVYFFAIEHCNRLGWKKKFGLPTTMAMEALGIKSYNTYKKVLLDLVKFGFISVIEYSKNQYSSNIVALSNFDKALDKALDKAMIKHCTKQSESTVQSIDSIDKPITLEPINIEQEEIKPTLNSVMNLLNWHANRQKKRLSVRTLSIEAEKFLQKYANDPPESFNGRARQWVKFLTSDPII